MSIEATLPRQAELRPWLPRAIAALAIALVAAAILIIAFAGARDPYPLTDGPGASQSGPATIGQPTQAVVVFIEPRPGDSIELLGAEPVGLPPDVHPTLYLSRAIAQPDGSWLTGEALEPLAGAVVATPSGASALPEHGVGIVAQMTPTTAGTYELTGVRLRFRINGGVEQVREGLSVLWTICADDPAPASCEPADPDS